MMTIAQTKMTISLSYFVSQGWAKSLHVPFDICHQPETMTLINHQPYQTCWFISPMLWMRFRMEGQEDKVTCQDHILISKRLTLCYPDFLGEIINVGTDPCYIVIYFFFSDGSYSSKIPVFSDFSWLNKQHLQMKELMILNLKKFFKELKIPLRMVS